MSSLRVVWLKRDLRIDDHAALAAAAAEDGGAMLALYAYEPDIWHGPDMDASHLAFIEECLAELEQALAQRGGRLVRRLGEMTEVLARLYAEAPFDELLAHEETGNGATYARDLRVARWCRRTGVRFREFRQHGVFRPNPGRDDFAARWERHMRAPRIPPPARFVSPDASTVEPGDPALGQGLALGVDTRAALRQRGGSAEAVRQLRSFLLERGVDYRSTMGSPVLAWESCSRLSTHLAWGSISVRRCHHAARRRLVQLEGDAAPDDHACDARERWKGSVRSFLSRLAWHCHFIQKLEDEPAIETSCMARSCESLRADLDPALARARLAAWQEGRTGEPMIDACMRALVATGWINFRMRAMLVSFASHHLWLDWRLFAPWLARQFLDYEPGIHYPQVQMQSATTGINTVRIYSPRKQVEDHDPRGTFVRRWVPELAAVPDEFLAEPSTMPELLQAMLGCRIGADYPAPVVEHRVAYREAQSRLFGLRATAESRAEAKRVYRKHGSRKRRRA